MRDAYFIYYSAYLKDDIQKKIKEMDCVIKKKNLPMFCQIQKTTLAQEENLAQRQSSVFKKQCCRSIQVRIMKYAEEFSEKNTEMLQKKEKLEK